jgi:hypothetical protein
MVKDSFNGVEGPMPAPDGGLYFSARRNRIYKLTGTAGLLSGENTKRTNAALPAEDGRLLCRGQ